MDHSWEAEVPKLAYLLSCLQGLEVQLSETFLWAECPIFLSGVIPASGSCLEVK